MLELVTMFRRVREGPWILCALGVLLLLFFVRWLPHESLTVAEGDSGMFLYAGQQINNGLAPYADVWDHKPPLIFYVNALGLRLAHGSVRGVVGLGYGAMLAFCGIIWIILRRRAGPLAATIAVLVAINLLPDVALSPNSTELFALPFQAAAFILLIREFEGGSALSYPALQGLIAAVLFQLRPNNAAIAALYIAISAYEGLRARTSKLLTRMAVFGVGFAIGNIAILWPILHRGQFREYWGAAFLYNAQYSMQRSMLMHVYSIGVGMLKTSRFGGILIAVIMGAVLVQKRVQWARVPDRLGILALTLLLFEIGGTAISGRAYEHYFLMWLLPVAVLAGLFVRQCETGIGARELRAPAMAAACGFLAVAVAFDGARAVAKAGEAFNDRRADVVRYVRERATSSDCVFVWGGYGDLAFRIGLRPASRYFSGPPMSHDPASYRAQAAAALLDVERRRPTFILEESGSRLPRVFSEPDTEPGNVSWDTIEISAIKKRLRCNYALVSVSSGGVRIYKINSSGAPGKTIQ